VPVIGRLGGHNSTAQSEEALSASWLSDSDVQMFSYPCTGSHDKPFSSNIQGSQAMVSKSTLRRLSHGGSFDGAVILIVE